MRDLAGSSAGCYMMQAMSTAGSSGRRVCAQCHGALSWDAAAEQLRCQGCGALQPMQEDGSFTEHDLAEALAVRRPKGRAGSGQRQMRCAECHAEVEFPDELLATRCAFCGSSLVLTQEAADDHYRPESLVPFSVDRAAATQAFQRWIGSRWLRPSDLHRASSLQEMQGVYIPYWAFSCEVTSRWVADAGYTYWVEQKTEAGTRRVPRTRWTPSSGQRHDQYQDSLICGSRGLASEITGPVHRFDTAALLPYAPEYLLGFSAERYAVDLRDAWKLCRQRISASQERRCASDVPGDSQRGLRATHQYQSVRFKHVLLPMWIAAYRYRGRTHRFLVNGQSGKVVGRAPLSLLKVSLLVLALLALVGLIYYYWPERPQPTNPLGPLGPSGPSGPS